MKLQVIRTPAMSVIRVQRVRGDLPHDIDDFCHLTYPIVVGVSLFV